MKKTLLFVSILLFSISLFGCGVSESQQKSSRQSSNKPQQQQSTESVQPVKSIIYINTEYGFSFSLPVSWNGYRIVTTKWEGVAVGGAQGEVPVETGPIISIRHRKWTSEIPRQDIPIMIFTISQWNALQQDKFHIGAAPIGPKELGRNSKYIFALPARYNFAFPAGYEEVEEILKNNPLQPIKINKQ